MTIESFTEAVKADSSTLVARISAEVVKAQVQQSIINAGTHGFTTSKESRGQPFRPPSTAAPSGGTHAGAGAKKQKYNGGGSGSGQST